MSDLTILHFSTTDRAGGAASCAYDIHRALKHAGMRSRMVVREKRSTDESIIEARPSPFLTRALQLVYGKIRHAAWGQQSAGYVFDFDETPPLSFASLLPLRPGEVDVLFVHWSNRLLTSRWIRRLHHYYRCPIVWFLADQQAMTGGCHYSFGCERFLGSCGDCPQLSPRQSRDRSRRTWERKARALSDLPITFVCGGDWALRQLEKSSLFRHRPTVRVPGIFDQALFRPADRAAARAAIGLRPEGKVVFFGASDLSDPRKGRVAFLDAQEQLHRRLLSPESRMKPGDVTLLFAGDAFESLRSTGRLKFPHHTLGLVRPEQLALAYQAANVFVCASTADVGPSMVVESLLCGTPVAGFSVGISAEILRSGLNGESVPARDAALLAEAIENILHWPDDELSKNRVAETCRRPYSESAAVKAYQKLFEDLKAGKRPLPSLLDV